MKIAAHTQRWRDAAIDYGIPLLLLAPGWLMLWAYPKLVSSGEVPVPAGIPGASGATTDVWTYLFVAVVFVPLVIRRKRPLLSLALTAFLSIAYSLTANLPAPVQIAPIAALYTVGTLRDRRTVWLAYAAVTVPMLAATVHPFSGVSWIADAMSLVTSLAVAASLGDASRSRRAYIAAVEQRAIDAERSREDEAKRRVEEERLRIARELHDVTAHSLSIVALQAGAAEKAVRRDPESAITALRTIRATSKDALDELRAMLGVLRSAHEGAPLSPAGRIERLPELVAAVEPSGIRVTLDVPKDLVDVPAYADVSAFRIVQESLTNVVRHANATSARVVIAREGEELVVTVTDDGCGRAAEGNEGHGIAGMRERVAALGGTFTAGPLDGKGFRVHARLPLSRGVQRRDD